jgi:hypothetical protein
MINFVRLQAEHLTESATDLIQEKHSLERILPIVIVIILTGSNHHWIVVVMAELSGIVAWDMWVVPEDRTVGIPFSDRRAVSGNGLLSVGPYFGSKAL